MPLGARVGCNGIEIKLCGVETEFCGQIECLIRDEITHDGFDFVLAPLTDPTYRPSSMGEFGPPPFTADFAVNPVDWYKHVIGEVSPWIDLDSENDILRIDSETILEAEIARAAHLSMQACLLPHPKNTSCTNYARHVNKILQGLNKKDMKVLLRIPLVEDDGSWEFNADHYKDPWEMWNEFRFLCEHHSQLAVALELSIEVFSEISLEHWFGEPINAVILQTGFFTTEARGSVGLSKCNEKILTTFFDHSIKIVISGTFEHKPSPVSQRLSFRSYLDYVDRFYRMMDPLPEKECQEYGHRDTVLLKPQSQILVDAQAYLALEKDMVRFLQYQMAISEALRDRVPDEEVSTLTTVLMVVGAGHGQLVMASLEAAHVSGRKLHVYAVEKNPDAVLTLRSLIKLKNFEDVVTVVSSDMRVWDPPEKADILVSELLGSFGDDELSPECLDGAQRFLKEDGISIPTSYTSYIQPVTASKIYNNVRSCPRTKLYREKTEDDIAQFETAYVVKLHSVGRLAHAQPVFTFSHPNRPAKIDNQRHTTLQFKLPNDTDSALVHGFSGYFDAVLYKDVHLQSAPSTTPPNMFSRFPIFFPLRTPVRIHKRGKPLEVNFWRCCSPKKVWYEWCVTSPTISPIHNSNGRSHSFDLSVTKK